MPQRRSVSVFPKAATGEQPKGSPFLIIREETNLNDLIISPETMRQMADTDIRTVDADSLVDIETVTIHPDLPDRERVQDFIRQIRNPYCYRYHGTVVKISFSGQKNLQDCIRECMFTN